MEITVNVKLSCIARNLRSLRMQKGLPVDAVAEACDIPLEDIWAFEMDKKIPSESEKKILFEFFNNYQ